jgi:hypothetical protein
VSLLSSIFLQQSTAAWCERFQVNGHEIFAKLFTKIFRSAKLGTFCEQSHIKEIDFTKLAFRKIFIRFSCEQPVFKILFGGKLCQIASGKVPLIAKFHFIIFYDALYMQAASFPFGPVNTMEEVFQDPQVRHNQLHQEVHHASLRTVKQVRLFSNSGDYKEMSSILAGQ